MRVCQPLPLAFQRFNTWGVSRRLMATFGWASGGRPYPAIFS